MGKVLQEKYKKEIEAIVATKEAERRIQFAAFNIALVDIVWKKCKNLQKRKKTEIIKILIILIIW